MVKSFGPRSVEIIRRPGRGVRGAATEGVIEFICEGGFGSEANVKLELRTEFAGIGGTIITCTLEKSDKFYIRNNILLVAVMALGPTRGDIMGLITSGKHDYIIWWVIFIVVAIAGASLITAVSELKGFRELTEPGSEILGTEELSATYQILVHPKVMGFVVLMLISIVTIHYMTKN